MNPLTDLYDDALHNLQQQRSGIQTYYIIQIFAINSMQDIDPCIPPSPDPQTRSRSVGARVAVCL